MDGWVDKPRALAYISSTLYCIELSKGVCAEMRRTGWAGVGVSKPAIRLKVRPTGGPPLWNTSDIGDCDMASLSRVPVEGAYGDSTAYGCAA